MTSSPQTTDTIVPGRVYRDEPTGRHVVAVHVFGDGAVLAAAAAEPSGGTGWQVPEWDALRAYEPGRDLRLVDDADLSDRVFASAPTDPVAPVGHKHFGRVLDLPDGPHVFAAATPTGPLVFGLADDAGTRIARGAPFIAAGVDVDACLSGDNILHSLGDAAVGDVVWLAGGGGHWRRVLVAATGPEKATLHELGADPAGASFAAARPPFRLVNDTPCIPAGTGWPVIDALRSGLAVAPGTLVRHVSADGHKVSPAVCWRADGDTFECVPLVARKSRRSMRLPLGQELFVDLSASVQVPAERILAFDGHVGPAATAALVAAASGRHAHVGAGAVVWAQPSSGAAAVRPAVIVGVDGDEVHLVPLGTKRPGDDCAAVDVVGWVGDGREQRFYNRDFTADAASIGDIAGWLHPDSVAELKRQRPDLADIDFVAASGRPDSPGFGTAASLPVVAAVGIVGETVVRAHTLDGVHVKMLAVRADLPGHPPLHPGDRVLGLLDAKTKHLDGLAAQSARRTRAAGIDDAAAWWEKRRADKEVLDAWCVDVSERGATAVDAATGTELFIPSGGSGSAEPGAAMSLRVVALRPGRPPICAPAGASRAPAADLSATPVASATALVTGLVPGGLSVEVQESRVSAVIPAKQLRQVLRSNKQNLAPMMVGAHLPVLLCDAAGRPLPAPVPDVEAVAAQRAALRSLAAAGEMVTLTVAGSRSPGQYFGRIGETCLPVRTHHVHGDLAAGDEVEVVLVSVPERGLPLALPPGSVDEPDLLVQACEAGTPVTVRVTGKVKGGLMCGRPGGAVPLFLPTSLAVRGRRPPPDVGDELQVVPVEGDRGGSYVVSAVKAQAAAQRQAAESLSAGDRFAATVTSVANFGVFVRLGFLPIDGVLHRDRLPDWDASAKGADGSPLAVGGQVAVVVVDARWDEKSEHARIQLALDDAHVGA